MSNPKRHHYVPRFLVKNFANSDGRVWTYSKVAPKAGVRFVRTEQVFVENELYTATNSAGEKDVSLELAFSAIEGSAAPVVEKIVAAGRSVSPVPLDEDERAAWDAFFIAQVHRTPDFTSQAKFDEDYEKVLASTVDEIAAKMEVLPEQREAFLKDANSKQFRQNIKVAALSKAAAPKLTEFISTCSLATVKVSDGGRSLAIGSNPTAKVRGFSLSGTAALETWLPLSHDVCVCVVAGSLRKTSYEFSTEAHIREFNMAAYGNSTAICASSELLVKSLVKAHRHTSEASDSD